MPLVLDRIIPFKIKGTENDFRLATTLRLLMEKNGKVIEEVVKNKNEGSLVQTEYTLCFWSFLTT